MKILLTWLLLMLAAARGHAQGPAATRPNLVFILADDMGWADAGCYGNPVHRTPHLDRLAAQGCRFTHGYAACAVCSPSRAALLTGLSPARLKLTNWLPGVVYPHARRLSGRLHYDLPAAETTLPEYLRRAGYATYHVGKWHLGEAIGPLQQGFEVAVGHNRRGEPGSYFFPYKSPAGDAAFDLLNLPGGQPGDYLTDQLTEAAVQQLRQAATQGRPFFLNLWHYAVHTPLQAPPDRVAFYRQQIAASAQPAFNPTYAAMLEALDTGVGRVLAELDRLGLSRNTIVVFISDNGGLLEVNGNAPLRAGKGLYYEGGIRVPWLMRFPEKIKAGTVATLPIQHTDLLPTLLALCGLPVPPGLDGHSFAGLFSGKPPAARPLLWHYPHYHTPTRPPVSAVLAGGYKLIHFWEDGHQELYQVEKDTAERHDLARSEPARRQQLSRQLHAWLRQVQAEPALPNPAFDPQQPFGGSFTDWQHTRPVAPR